MHRVTKAGDTIVEVTFAIAVFAFVAIISISLMNNGIAKAQQALEITMTRNEIDAQAEALRFIHNAFLSERNLSNKKLGVSEQRESNKWYAELWRKLTRDYDDSLPLTTVQVDPNGNARDNGLAIMPNKLASLNIENCDDAYDQTKPGNIYNNNAFVVNTRMLSPNTALTGGNNNVIYLSKDPNNTFSATPIYPRIIYSRTSASNSSDNSDEMLVEADLYRLISRVEGIWVISVRDATGFHSLTENYTPTRQELARHTPEYFDFHIRTCWYAPGRDIPTTIGTIVRLYNPEYVESSR